MKNKKKPQEIELKGKKKEEADLHAFSPSGSNPRLFSTTCLDDITFLVLLLPATAYNQSYQFAKKL